MIPTPSPLPPVPDRHATHAFRWDLAAIVLAVLVAIGAAVLLDTGRLAIWMAVNKEAKTDEILVVSFVLVCAVGLFSIRRWLMLSHRLIKLEVSAPPVSVTGAPDVQSAFRRDLLGLSLALVLAVIAVSLLDTGWLAEWIARQSHTRVDEVIVSVFVLMIGLTFFSIRRWLELSQELRRSETLYLAMTQLNREAAVLGDLSDLLQLCRSEDEAYRLLADRAEMLFPGSSGAVCTIANSRDVVDVAMSWGHPALTGRFFEPADCWALRRGQPNVLGYEQAGVRCGHIGPDTPGRAICMPMMAQGESLGVLYLDTGRPDTGAAPAALAAWSAAELRLAKTLSEHAALALANLALRETLRRQSVRDPLTGLYNRRFLEESLERELGRATRSGLPFGLMMIDIDHFKRLNDTYGHDAGDAVLRALGNLLRAQLRSEDVVCRYGGEEFTMILPEASHDATQARAESLREAAAQLIVNLRGQTLERVTISVGVSSFPEHGVTADALLRAADAALYRAKESGRNRVIVA
jgi:diguanylate cyclase